jgi:hypothetical protein
MKWILGTFTDSDCAMFPKRVAPANYNPIVQKRSIVENVPYCK